MKTAEEILIKNGVISELTFNKGHYEYRYNDPLKLVPSMEEYANQFKPKWISVKDAQLHQNSYYLACRYGIHNIPDIVGYLGDDRFYSVKLGQEVRDVAYVMELPTHPTGIKEVIDFQPTK